MSAINMLPAFVQRFILPLAQRSIQSLIRCSCFIIDQLHVHPGHGSALESIEGNLPKDAASTKKSYQAYLDVFESPCFVSTDYKDDRAAVNLANIASHANSHTHKKNCECKPCRDRRPAFPRSGAGRRYGYRGTPIQTRTAAVALDCLSQSVSTPLVQGQESAWKSRPSKLSQEVLPAVSRLRVGNFRNLQAGSNRFAPLHVERTKDEGDYERSTDERDDHNSDDVLGNHSAQPILKDDGGHPQESSTCYSLAPPMARLDSWLETDLDNIDLNAADPEDNGLGDIDPGHCSATSAVPSTHHDRSITVRPRNISRRLHARVPYNHASNTIHSDGATNGASKTPDDQSKLMPWNEDNWAERKELGVRGLSWTTTRLLLRYTHGEDEVEYFVGRDVL